VRVVLPASGWLMMAKVRRRLISSDRCMVSVAKGERPRGQRRPLSFILTALCVPGSRAGAGPTAGTKALAGHIPGSSRNASPGVALNNFSRATWFLVGVDDRPYPDFEVATCASKTAKVAIHAIFYR